MVGSVSEMFNSAKNLIIVPKKEVLLISFFFSWQHKELYSKLKIFFLDIFFIYISNAIPFPSFSSENPLSSPPSPCSSTNPLLIPGTSIPLYWGTETSQDKGPFLPLKTD